MAELQETTQAISINPIEDMVREGENGLFTTSLIIAQAFEKITLTC